MKRSWPVLVLVCAIGLPVAASAQSLNLSSLSSAAAVATTAPPADKKLGKKKHWAVNFSMTPTWNMAPKIRQLISDNGGQVNIGGRELTIGIGRASVLGGQWSISFARKNFREGSNVVEDEQQCLPNPCFNEHTVHTFRNVRLTGFEADWFFSFATIKRVVQLGLGVGAGITSVKGTVRESKDTMEVVGFNNQTHLPILAPQHTEEDQPASDQIPAKFPLIKLEFVTSVIVAAPLKFQVAYGLNFPGYSARIMLVYLIGAKGAERTAK